MSMELYSKSVRIRLCFEERGMLKKAQLDQGLAKSWYLFNADVMSIGQLAARIEHDFRLRVSCPYGIMLEMCGFVLPPAQSTRILQDSDLVSVRRKQDGVSGEQSKELATHSVSIDDEEVGLLLAPDEFEKEAGGYQSEHSEDADSDFSFGSGKKMRGDVNGMKKLMARESSGKKRKRPIQTLDDIFVSPSMLEKKTKKLQAEPLERKKQKSSGKKKRNKIRHGDHGSSEVLPLQLDMPEGLPRSEPIDDVPAKIKKKKNKELAEQTGIHTISRDSSGSRDIAPEAKPSKERKVKSRKENEDLERPHMEAVSEEGTHQRSSRRHGDGLDAALESRLQKLTPEAGREGKKSRNSQDANLVNSEQESLQKKSEVREKSGNDNRPEQTDPVEKRPSRSARRKKAKKRWLREQAQLQNHLPSKKDDIKAAQTHYTKSLDTSESESLEEDSDGEEASAEEEILPRVVAPGHIRFENYEDERDEGHRTATVALSYPQVKCKQQGQAWGQEKSQSKKPESGHYRKGEKSEHKPSEGRMDQTDQTNVVAQKIDFENLSVLNRDPWIGDVLAYRLVELTASWTPELSSYRVGKVTVYDGTSKMITLIAVPEYPLHLRQSEGVEESEQQDEDLLPPYNPDGSLEVHLTTLMDLKVLKEGPVSCSSDVQPISNAQKSLDVVTADFGVSSEPLQPTTLENKVLKHAEPTTDINLNEQSIELGPPSNHGEFSTAGWQDMLSEAINRKRKELSSKALEGLEESEGAAPAGDVKNDSGKLVAREEAGKRQPQTNGPPVIRHRHMRTGALGPTMALLRANQVL